MVDATRATGKTTNVMELVRSHGRTALLSRAAMSLMRRVVMVNFSMATAIPLLVNLRRARETARE